MDDGLIELKVIDKSSEGLKCQVLNGGTLLENKGINAPESTFSVHSITEKDYADILFCIKAKIDFIALSFVRSAQEVRHLKEFIASRNTTIKVFAKIEKREALDCLEEIIDTSDGILVARGDLAVEVGNPRVPVLQKKLVRRSSLKGKTVIIATQMLMSMVNNPQPSRAEASDVANAIVDGADAIMLSNETAVGKFPIESLRMMNQIAIEMESEPTSQPVLYDEWELPSDGQFAVALLQSAVRLASILKAKGLVVMTRSGRSSVLISKCRPKNRILAMTGNLDTYRQLSIHWGVEPVLVEDIHSLAPEVSILDKICDVLLTEDRLRFDDRIILTAGLPQLTQEQTNTIKVWRVRTSS